MTGCQVTPSWQGKERGGSLLDPQEMGQVPGRLSGAVKTLVSTKPVHLLAFLCSWEDKQRLWVAWTLSFLWIGLALNASSRLLLFPL